VAEGAGDVSAVLTGASAPVASFADTFSGAFDFILHERAPEGVVGDEVGGIGQCMELLLEHVEVSVLALIVSLAIALPLGVWLGHRGRGEFLAIAIGNAGRAIPELALIAFMVAFIGFGTFNLVIALMVLGIPPILTNSFVGIRQVDRGAVEAARGMGMSELAIVTRVEMPLAVPTIMTGVRTAAIAIIATATIAPLAGVLTLGDFIINFNVYGEEGVLAGAILVALLALVAELLLAGLQRLLTPKGIAPRERPAGLTA
jgi:osmoprotectant transport system permease protein